MIDIENLLAAYSQGYFPMAQGRWGKEIHWYSPDQRGIIPLDDFHVPRSLQKQLKNFSVSFDQVFPQVITACAEAPRRAEGGNWINDEIIETYIKLWKQGFGHSVEIWQDNQLVGGLYGVALGRAFFGESMFSSVPNASRVALVHLVDLLKNNGYELLDTQYINPHLVQFGTIEIPRSEYLRRLEAALRV